MGLSPGRSFPRMSWPAGFGATRGFCAFVALLLVSGSAGPLAAQPPTPNPSDAPYIVERMHIAARFEADGTGETVQEVRFRIQNAAGVQQLGQVVFPYFEGRDKVDIDRLVVTHPDGRQERMDRRLLRRTPAPATAAFPLYSDLKLVAAPAPSLSPGDTLEWRLVERLVHPDTPGRYSMNASFVTQVPAEEQLIEADVPAQPKPKVHTNRGVVTREQEEKGCLHYSWTYTPPKKDSGGAERKDEDASPRGYDVALTSFGSWREVGQWYRGLEADRAEPDAALDKVAESLVSGRKGDSARIEALYHHVSSTIRYFALALGMARYQPHRAAEIQKNGYGDCKDKHTLFAALLRAAGYDAYPVLVSAQPMDLLENLPTPIQFNHAITAVRVDGKLWFLDSTSQADPFRYLAPPLRGKKGLLIGHGDEATRLVELPKALPFESTEVFSLQGRVSEDGTLEAHVEERHRGDIEFVLRTAFLQAPSGAWERIVSRVVASDGIKGEVSKVAVANPADATEPLRLTYALTVKDYLPKTGGAFPVLLPKLYLEDLEKKPSAPDSAPFALSPSRVDADMQVTLPKGVAVDPPAPVEVSKDFASLSSRYAVSGARLTAERTLRVLQNDLPAARKREYEIMQRAVNADYKQRFSLRHPLTASGGAAGASADSLVAAPAVAAKQNENARAIDLLQQAVKSDPKHKTAWYRLGLALQKADRKREALQAFERQLEIDPYHEKAASWAAHMHEDLKEFEAAEAGYRKELESFPLNQCANARLGQMLADQRRWEEALPFLQKAVALKSSDRDSLEDLVRAGTSLGRIEIVKRAFGRLVDTGDDPAYLLDLAEILLSSRDHDLARLAETAARRVIGSARDNALPKDGKAGEASADDPAVRAEGKP